MKDRYRMPEAERETLRQQIMAKAVADLPELTKLLKQCSGHWGYEDPIYRFYHGSFKVFRLQDTTVEIVAALASLDPTFQPVTVEFEGPDKDNPRKTMGKTRVLPDTPLNDSFMEIMRLGTGKCFTDDTNANWMASTRPIVEAFFHARFMLEMAVRYGQKYHETGLLESGLAAFLYLYDLR